VNDSVNKKNKQIVLAKANEADLKSLGEQTTGELKSDNDMNIRSIIDSKPTTPISLLVESLIQQLCTLLETDPKKSNLLYKKICERLYKMNLIDNSYAMSEFENMRFQFQSALYQLVSVTKGEDLPIHLDNVWPLSLQSPQKGLEWSRYHREFEEFNVIAEGNLSILI
jgi:translation initiation factor 2-alpha kinase 1